MIRFPLSLALAAWCLPLACWAAPAGGLQWKQTVVEVAGMRSDGQLVARFDYANAGNRTVRILSTKTTCGCTVAKPSLEEVAPGESGSIEVTYKVASKTGYYEAPITVRTDDPGQPETKLSMRLRVRDEVEMSQKLVLWKSGEPPEPKRVSFVPGDGKTIDRLESKTSGEGVDLRVERSGAGFDLVLTPREGAKNARGTVEVTPERGGKTLRTLRLLYRVM